MSTTVTTAPGAAGGTHVVNTPLTTATTAAVVPSLLRNTIDERIVRVRPTSTPIDQITRCIGSRACSSMTVEYYSVDTRSAVTFTVGLGTGRPETDDGGHCIIGIQVEDTSIFAVSDTVLLPDIRDKENSPLAAYVKEVSGDTITIVILNNIAFGDFTVEAKMKVVRMGRAASELDVQTGQYQALPHKSSNNCQIFKMQIEQSTLQKFAGKEVDWNFSDQEEAAIIDMRMGMEKNFLFGTRARITAPNGRESIYLTGGIWGQAGCEAQLTLDGLDEKAVMDMCANVFTGNGGSRRRILMGGTGLILALSKLPFTRTVGSENSVTRWGIRFREIVTNFGSLFVVHSETFDLCGHPNDGFIIDPDYITKYTHIPFSKERIDLRRAGDRNTDAVVLTEASCVVLRNPRVHFRVIGK